MQRIIRPTGSQNNGNARRGRKTPDPSHSAEAIDFALRMRWISAYEARLYLDTSELLAAGVWLTYKQWRKRRDIHDYVAENFANGPGGDDDA